MKGKKIILLFSSAILLSGCGVVKVKSPKHSVSYDTFIENLLLLERTNDMYLSDYKQPTYSFVCEIVEEQEEKTRVISKLTNKEISKLEDEYSADGTIKYDASSQIFLAENKEEKEHEAEGEKSSSEKEIEVQMQTANGCIAVINKIKKIYAVAEWDSPYDRMNMAAVEVIDEFVELFTDKIYRDADFYIDDNRYTINYSESDSDSYQSFTRSYSYQLTLKNNEAILACEEHYSSTTYSEKETTYYTKEHKASMEFERKSVSLKKVDISKYTEVNNLSMDFLIF